MVTYARGPRTHNMDARHPVPNTGFHEFKLGKKRTCHEYLSLPPSPYASV